MSVRKLSALSSRQSACRRTVGKAAARRAATHGLIAEPITESMKNVG